MAIFQIGANLQVTVPAGWSVISITGNTITVAGPMGFANVYGEIRDFARDAFDHAYRNCRTDWRILRRWLGEALRALPPDMTAILPLRAPPAVRSPGRRRAVRHKCPLRNLRWA
jgi:hypothetical protein